MPDRSRSGALALVLMLATVAGAQSPSPSVATPRGARTLTLTSDAETAVVDVADARQLTAGLQSVIQSRVQGLDIVQDSAGVKLRIQGTPERGATYPLFVIDGVPVADGYALSIFARVIDRIDVFQDAVSTKPYGVRAANGVVMIATARRP
jgi:TonB-dependent SusC/RagA subfamily outer membrane receptor